MYLAMYLELSDARTAQSVQRLEAGLAALTAQVEAGHDTAAPSSSPTRRRRLHPLRSAALCAVLLISLVPGSLGRAASILPVVMLWLRRT